MSSPVIPTFRYRDAPAMIAWLEAALGFTVQARYGDGDQVDHAQLVHGAGMIMLGSDGDASQSWMSEPGAGSVYLVVPDARATYDRAVAAGAEVLDELSEKDYGGWGFTVRGPEGTLWSAGEYDPWVAA